MSWSGGIVTFAVLWFITLLCVLPFGAVSQDEAGEIVPGSPPGAPSSLSIKRKFAITTLITCFLWAIVYFVMSSGWITIDSLRRFGA